MPALIANPMTLETLDDPAKTIEVYAGEVTTGTDQVSIAVMTTPGGWAEPGQCPEFEEWSVVLRGVLVVEHREGELEVGAGQAVRAHPGEWVRYRTPYHGGAQYLSVCLPAFSPARMHRDDDEAS